MRLSVCRRVRVAVPLRLSTMHFKSHRNRNPAGRVDVRIASRKQIVKMLVAVVALFYVCLLPLRSITIWIVFDSPSNVEKLGFHGYLNLLNSARLLMFVNSAGNPLIYGLMCAKFRTAFGTALPFFCLRNQGRRGSVILLRGIRFCGENNLESQSCQSTRV